MNRPLLCLTLALCPVSSRAEGIYDHELKNLTEQRDREFAAQSLQINKAYRANLERLLLRAIQTKDIAAVAKISEELRNLPETAPPDPMAPPASKPATARPSAAPSAPTKSPISGALSLKVEKLLVSHTWLRGVKYHYHFAQDGTFFRDEVYGTGRYKINPQSGYVDFQWDANTATEGLAFDQKTGKFTHSDGGTFAPAD